MLPIRGGGVGTIISCSIVLTYGKKFITTSLLLIHMIGSLYLYPPLSLPPPFHQEILLLLSSPLIMENSSPQPPTPTHPPPVKPALKHPTKNNDLTSVTNSGKEKHLTWDEHAIEEHDVLRGTRMKASRYNGII